MFDFGDEFTIDSYRIPWLIWIQILVFVLLILLLYSFSLFALDLTDDNRTTASPSALSISHVSHLDKPITKQQSAVTTSLQNAQVGENQSIKGEIATSTSRRRIVRGEDMTERESSSPMTNMYYHPCYYIRLARVVFLKCLGLDSTPETSSTSEHRRDS